MTTNEIQQKLSQTVEVLAKELRGLRLGRANAEMLDGVRVEAYGSSMPISQVASIQTPSHDQILIQPWDGSVVSAIEKAIRISDLNVNPSVDGTMIRITLPPLTAERRQELVKIANKQAEEARIALRNVREEAMDDLERAFKAKEISEDEKFRSREAAQKAVDAANAQIKEMVEKKEQEILND